MKLRNLAVYLVLFIVLGLFYYVYEVRIGEKDRELEAAKTRIYDLAVDQVTRVKLTVGDELFEMVMDKPPVWKLIEPMETPADRWEVENVIRQVIDGEKDREFAEPVADLAEFGLDKPAISLSLYAGDRLLAPTLHLGAVNPAGFLSYARLGDSRRVFTVIPVIREALDKTLFDLRDRSLVLMGGETMDKLILEGSERVELKRRGIRSWDMVRPEPGPADGDVVQRLIYHGLKGRVMGIAKADEADSGKVEWPATHWPDISGDPHGFQAPRLKITVASRDGAEVFLEVGKTFSAPAADGSDQPSVAGYWVRTSERPGEVMVIGVRELAVMALGRSELIERHVMNLNPALLEEITATAGGRRLYVKKQKNLFWDVLEPGNPTSQPADIERFLKYLEDLRWVREEGPGAETVKEYGLDDPDIMVELDGPEVKHVLAVSLRPVEEKFMAARAGDGPVVLIDRVDFMNALPDEVRPEIIQSNKDEQGGREK